MQVRCDNSPQSSVPCAIARLDSYKWIICERGYANVVDGRGFNPASSPKAAPSDTVYGLLYDLSPADEAELDLYEGHNSSRNPVPKPNPDPDTRDEKPFLQGNWDYNKHYLNVTITKWLVKPSKFGLDDNQDKVRVLAYVDELRTQRGVINDEYIGRMNRAIREAVELGLPLEYVNKELRRDIPLDGGEAHPSYVGTEKGYVENDDRD